MFTATKDKVLSTTVTGSWPRPSWYDTNTGGERFAHLPPGLKQGANRRLAGEDVEAGSVLVEAGVRMRPQDVASAAACGLDRLRCYAPLKVAIVSTGDEILRAGGLGSGGFNFDAKLRRQSVDATDLFHAHMVQDRLRQGTDMHAVLIAIANLLINRFFPGLVMGDF